MATPLHSPPAPSLLPPAPPAMSTPSSSTLPGRINASTQKQHIELNRLLVQRLPLALPPHVKTPLLFSKGIVPFARIFILFEIEWELLTRHFHRNAKDYAGRDFEVREWLVTLRPPGLARSPRLKNDLRHLRSAGGPGIFKTPALGDEWMKRMRDLMRKKPHVFIAFAWVFYMAVFSGGRWIRRQLANSGIQFWTQQHELPRLETDQQPSDLELPGISFLSFDGEQDGEELKSLFKTRLADADRLLNDEEKEEVIAVAKQLFDRSIRLVNELDRLVYRQRMMNWVPTILYSAVVLAVPPYLLYMFGASFLWP